MRTLKDKDGNEVKVSMAAGDIKDYEELAAAFVSLGFPKAEVEAIHDVTAAALHCGELELDASTFDDGKANTPVSITSTACVKQIAKLLGIQDYQDLITEIVMKGAFEGVATRSPDKLANVENAVGSLAKGLFDNMFNWLVVTMNQEILPEALKSPTPSQLSQFNMTTQTVGLLDIFGFENFELNQFEQLCINYVNEKLHNLYISSIFGAEKKEMEREGLNVKLKMPDLKVLDVLLLMANGNSKAAPYGLFQLVADKSGSGMGTADMKKRS